MCTYASALEVGLIRKRSLSLVSGLVAELENCSFGMARLSATARGRRKAKTRTSRSERRRRRRRRCLRGLNSSLRNLNASVRLVTIIDFVPNSFPDRPRRPHFTKRNPAFRKYKLDLSCLRYRGENSMLPARTRRGARRCAQFLISSPNVYRGH